VTGSPFYTGIGAGATPEKPPVRILDYSPPGSKANSFIAAVLTELRKETDDQEAQDVIDGILAGKRPFRDLFEVPDFLKRVSAGTERYRAQREHMSPEELERDQIAARELAHEAGLIPGSERDRGGRMAT
jgi:hypothetical protein